MKAIHCVAFILLVVGGLNWLLVGLVPGWDLANYIGGGSVAVVVYVLVGLSAIYELLTHKRSCCKCSGKCSGKCENCSAGLGSKPAMPEQQ